jgi:hypothetical protein
VALGYITAGAMPPIGAIIAIVIALRPTRPYSGHWRWIMLVSIVAAGVWLAIIASGALKATDNSY